MYNVCNSYQNIKPTNCRLISDFISWFFNKIITIFAFVLYTHNECIFNAYH